MSVRKLVLYVLMVIVSLVASQHGIHADAPVNLITNPGLESMTDGFPSGWFQDKALLNRGEVAVDTSVKRSGNSSIKLIPNRQNTDSEHLLGIGQLIQADNLIGKRLRFSVAFRSSEEATAAAVVIAFTADGKITGSAALNQLFATSSFNVQDTYLQVGPNTKGLLVACAVTGTSGQVWLDDFSLVEDAPWVPFAEKSDLAASITVDAGKVIRQIPRTLFGTNIEWIWNGNGVWDAENDRLNQAILPPAKDLGLATVRFPGGFFSDYYHWRDGIGPRSARPSKPESPTQDPKPNNFGLPELMEFCKATAAEPLLTVNMITGTPGEAADWISYCNQPNNPERLKNGVTKPYNVRYWEIGNEQYLKGEDMVGQTSHLSTDEYIRRFKEWSTAMKKADPTIKILAVGGSNYGRQLMVYDEDWNKKLLQQAAPGIDYLAVHNAYAPAFASASNASFYEVYGSLMAYSKLVEGNLQNINRQIDTYAPAHANRIKLAVTEWGPIFGVLPSDRWVDHCKTLGSALYVADVMRVFLNARRLELANFFKLTESSFMGCIDGKGVPKPSYYALQMYTRHFGSELVSTSVQGPTFDSKPVFMIDPVQSVPYLEAVSSLSADRSRMYVIVINKHFTSPVKAKLKLQGFSPQASGTAWTLTGPSLDANNGQDLLSYPTLWAEQVHAPQNSAFDSGKPDSVVTRKSQFLITGDLEYTFPPLSVTSLELDRK